MCTKICIFPIVQLCRISFIYNQPWISSKPISKVGKLIWMSKMIAVGVPSSSAQSFLNKRIFNLICNQPLSLFPPLKESLGVRVTDMCPYHQSWNSETLLWTAVTWYLVSASAGLLSITWPLVIDFPAIFWCWNLKMMNLAFFFLIQQVLRYSLSDPKPLVLDP